MNIIPISPDDLTTEEYFCLKNEEALKQKIAKDAEGIATATDTQIIMGALLAKWPNCGNEEFTAWRNELKKRSLPY